MAALRWTRQKHASASPYGRRNFEAGKKWPRVEPISLLRFQLVALKRVWGLVLGRRQASVRMAATMVVAIATAIGFYFAIR